jgi:hypothetical protein
MTVADKKYKPKSRSAILETAIRHAQGYKSTLNWGQRMYYILLGVWETAFCRGYAKALRDQTKEAT